MTGGCPYKKDAHTGRGPCDNEDRNWVIHLKTKERQRLSAKPQKPWERPRTPCPSQPSEGAPTPCHILILDFYRPELGGNQFLLFKPPHTLVGGPLL